MFESTEPVQNRTLFSKNNRKSCLIDKNDIRIPASRNTFCNESPSVVMGRNAGVNGWIRGFDADRGKVRE